MEPEQLFTETARLRGSLADLLESLSDREQRSMSWCGRWDIITVGAHLAVGVTTPLPMLMAAVIRHGGSVHRANDRLARQLARQPDEVVRLLRQNAGRRLSPPRNGPVAPMTEALIHSCDIYRPLGLDHAVPPKFAEAALDYIINIRPLNCVPRGRLSGLSFVASDVDFIAGGGGQLQGHGIDLLMAASGRTEALRDLTGPGVDVLRGRLSAHRSSAAR